MENNLPQNQSNQIRIKATDEKLKGEYANFTQISHSQNEVTLDFITILAPSGIFPGSGELKQRIIVSPAHFKSMLEAMKNVMLAHETQFGTVKPSESPASRIGFEAKE